MKKFRKKKFGVCRSVELDELRKEVRIIGYDFTTQEYIFKYEEYQPSLWKRFKNWLKEISKENL